MHILGVRGDCFENCGHCVIEKSCQWQQLKKLWKFYPKSIGFIQILLMVISCIISWYWVAQWARKIRSLKFGWHDTALNISGSRDTINYNLLYRYQSVRSQVLNFTSELLLFERGRHRILFDSTKACIVNPITDLLYTLESIQLLQKKWKSFGKILICCHSFHYWWWHFG